MTSVIIQKSSKYYNNINNLVIGKMKNETFRMPIKTFARLKSKMYTFMTAENHESVKVNENAVDNRPNMKITKMFCSINDL